MACDGWSIGRGEPGLAKLRPWNCPLVGDGWSAGRGEPGITKLRPCLTAFCGTSRDIGAEVVAATAAAASVETAMGVACDANGFTFAALPPSGCDGIAAGACSDGGADCNDDDDGNPPRAEAGIGEADAVGANCVGALPKPPFDGKEDEVGGTACGVEANGFPVEFPHGLPLVIAADGPKGFACGIDEPHGGIPLLPIPICNPG